MHVARIEVSNIQAIGDENNGVRFVFRFFKCFQLYYAYLAILTPFRPIKY